VVDGIVGRLTVVILTVSRTVPLLDDRRKNAIQIRRFSFLSTSGGYKFVGEEQRGTIIKEEEVWKRERETERERD
jgi:hypothetical protein